LTIEDHKITFWAGICLRISGRNLFNIDDWSLMVVWMDDAGFANPRSTIGHLFLFTIKKGEHL